MTTHTDRKPDRELEQPTDTPAVNPDDVARRAYELYEARGAEPGQDLEDWLRAERELETPKARKPSEPE